ncbi:hypothetical protein PVAP13_9NG358300 [Panicum virgatum]|uniref:RRM domain-containing protein n=1 Tax=Panicum virgatum TaxID=38727 RepID=A0A8T0MQB7_PANVG|nr:hypothetical protein PVAP13_9NG358300 [Panicum virgatum]
MGDYGHGGGQMRGNPDSRPRGQGQRPNVQQLKLMGQIHPTGLTPNLLKLFEPRPPLEYKPPLEKRKLPAYTGMAQFVSQFAEPGDPEYAPPVPTCETRAEKKARIRNNKLEQGAAKVAEELQKYDPQSDPNATGDPYKTLFVARLNYETSEHKIKREFEAYGPIKRVRLVTEKDTSKPRGYAFIEYMHTRDMKNAYKQADGRKVDNKRVLVDVERGRTVPNWRPRRLGGGLGSSRMGGADTDKKDSAREQQHGGRPRSEEPRRDDRRAERDREKSRERVRERERDERPRERSHDRTRDRDSREEKHHHRDRTVVKEIMSAPVTSGNVATCIMRGMQTMAMVGQNMTKVCPVTGRIMTMDIMSNTKVMRHMVMVKMDVGMNLSTQRGMTMSTIVLTRTVKWKPTIRCSLTMQNLKGLRKVRHMRKATISTTELVST